MNSTGISAIIGGSAAVGKPIFNATDGSIAFIKSVATDAVTTTPLLGGSDNTWQNADTWRIDEFVLSLEKISTSGYGVDSVTQREECLIIARSTDNLTVATGGRGYNSTVAATFDADDHARLLVTAPNYDRIKDYLYSLATKVETNTNGISDFSSTSNAKGASLIGIEDAGGNYTGTNVETALTEIDTRLDATVTLAGIGFYGDGSDGTPTWTSGASLNPATEKRYTTATLPVSQTLTVSSVNTPLIIHNSGNVTINGIVDLSGKGGAGGSAGAAGGNGGAGTAGNSLLSGLTVGSGTGATAVASNNGASGGSGASMLAAGTNGTNNSGSTGGTAGAAMSGLNAAFLAGLLRGVACGGGGGGGAGGKNGGAGAQGTGGAGGAGGGALVWLIGGNLTLGASSQITVAGAAGGNGEDTANWDGGAGSGGGAGIAIILVAGSITNSGTTLTASGGGAGTAGGGSGSAGVAGANGKIVIYSLSTGTLITA